MCTFCRCCFRRPAIWTISAGNRTMINPIVPSKNGEKWGIYTGPPVSPHLPIPSGASVSLTGIHLPNFKSISQSVPNLVRENTNRYRKAAVPVIRTPQLWSRVPDNHQVRSPPPSDTNIFPNEIINRHQITAWINNVAVVSRSRLNTKSSKMALRISFHI